MLGAPCSPCCDPCGPELSSLPNRFEVDVISLDADEKHWGARYAIWYLPFATADFSTGYVQNWHSAGIASQTYSLPLQSVQSGVATYELLAPGIVLRIVCTPTSDGRYSAYFTCVPCRTTTQVYGTISGIGGRPTVAVGMHPADVLQPDSDRPTSPTREFETLEQMRADSTTINTAGATNGQRSDGLSGPYISKIANHSVTVGARLVCPVATIAGSNTINIETVSATATFTNQNWPMQIRSQARINLPTIRNNWYTRNTVPNGFQLSGYHVRNVYPQSGTQGVPPPSGGGYANEFGFGPFAWRVVFDASQPRPGFPFGDNINYSIYGWANTFTRNLDITQIRAVFPGSTQQWPQP